FRVDRIGEGGAGARDVERGGGHSYGRADEPGCREGAEKFQGFLSCSFETILFEFFRGETPSRRGSSPTAHVLASLLAAGVCLTLRRGYPAGHGGVPMDPGAVRISAPSHVILYDRLMTGARRRWRACCAPGGRGCGSSSTSIRGVKTSTATPASPAARGSCR